MFTAWNTMSQIRFQDDGQRERHRERSVCMCVCECVVCNLEKVKIRKIRLYLRRENKKYNGLAQIM